MNGWFFVGGFSEFFFFLDYKNIDSYYAMPIEEKNVLDNKCTILRIFYIVAAEKWRKLIEKRLIHVCYMHTKLLKRQQSLLENIPAIKHRVK